ncbi:MAG: hypothetical protein IIA67_10575 [Planctomycetes bacterium]|nr:hypothetical protein [Planctomycetota bacterium]
MASLAKAAVGLFVCLFFYGSVAATAVDGFAPPRGKGKKPERQRFMSTGTVEALLPNSVIRFSLPNKEIWHVKLAPPKRERDKRTRRYVFKGGTEVQVTGTAKADFLRRGMYIRFSAGFDAKGKSSDTIDLLTIFTPDESRKLGIFREGFAAGDDEVGKKAGATKQFLVSGQLASFKNGIMSVVVGGTKVQIAVAEDAQINVDVNDASLAQKGDKIEVEGHYFQKGAVLGKIVKIELSKPLVGTAKKSKKKPKKSKRPAAKKPKTEPESQQE